MKHTGTHLVRIRFGVSEITSPAAGDMLEPRGTQGGWPFVENRWVASGNGTKFKRTRYVRDRQL